MFPSYCLFAEYPGRVWGWCHWTVRWDDLCHLSFHRQKVQRVPNFIFIICIKLSVWDASPVGGECTLSTRTRFIGTFCALDLLERLMELTLCCREDILPRWVGQSSGAVCVCFQEEQLRRGWRLCVVGAGTPSRVLGAARMVKKPCDCGVWLVPSYTNIMSCFVEDLNNQHSGTCLELLYGPSGVVVMSQLMMDVQFWNVQLTEAAEGFPFAASARGGVSGSLDQLLQVGSSDFYFIFLVRSHAVLMSASVLFHLTPWNRHFSWSALCVGTTSSRGASIVLPELGAPKQQCRDWVMMVWALLGCTAKFLVMFFFLRGEATASGSTEEDVLSCIWGNTERSTCFFQFFEMVGIFSCVFLEISEALKCNNSSLPATSDERKALHHVALPFCCVPTKPPSLVGSGVGDSGWGLKHSSVLSPCCPTQPAASKKPFFLRSGCTSAPKKGYFITGYHFW